jgi:FtsP/CotA-like multicopper oxidase with cupredoxin domain
MCCLYCVGVQNLFANWLALSLQDVGANTFELWELETGGGWYHPIHVHLVSFFVILRNGKEENVFPYERDSAKDVVSLGPSERIHVIAR